MEETDKTIPFIRVRVKKGHGCDGCAFDQLNCDSLKNVDCGVFDSGLEFIYKQKEE